MQASISISMGRLYIFPHITFCLSIATLGIAVAQMGRALQFEPPMRLTYRLFTCHFAHWSTNHLLWSGITFVVLGGICESWDRARFLICLLVTAVMIPATLALLQPGLPSYRGLSGLDSALFTLAAGLMLRRMPIHRRGMASRTVIVLLAAMSAKLAYELIRGQALFVHDGRFVPSPLAHVVGAVIGIGCAFAGPRPARGFIPASRAYG